MAAANGGEPTIDALGQFKLYSLAGPLDFTQSNLMMVVGAALTLALLYFGMRPRAIVPGRLQAAAELAYKFIYDMCIDQVGPEGRKFFPFVFTLFFFVLMGNLLGIIPYSFTYTSHIAVTGALALMVVVLVTIVAIRENGARFFTEYFFPKGAPVALAPLIIPIEVISYLSRIVSLSVRLFANMVAGHVMFAVFATFTILLANSGMLGHVVGPAVGLLPIAVNIALVGFELLVACLQAYVFAILTCIYLHDAVHLH
ncbi:MAG TPA: F0F1 ATP synthase subunit A [Acidisphaera sp.]|nr:F0F1 ATP synthase subunit A [Acidisphaera sp.]